MINAVRNGLADRLPPHRMKRKGGVDMAVVADYYDNGAHVIIRDDAYANASPQELARREEEFYRVVARIIHNATVRATRRHLMEQAAAGKEN